MPEFTVKEVRLPELRLPEIKREDIVRSLSGVRLPEVDLGRAKPAGVKLPTGIKVPAVSLSSADIAKLMAAAAAVARFARPASTRKGLLTRLPFSRSTPSPIARIVPQRKRRSRLPILLAVVVVAATTAWAILRQPKARQRLEEAATAARERFDTMRASESGTQANVDVPVAFTAANTAPMESNGFATATDDAGAPSTGSDYPDGLGADSSEADGIPAFEETGSQA